MKKTGAISWELFLILTPCYVPKAVGNYIRFVDKDAQASPIK